MTNFEKVKQMSVDELTDFLNSVSTSLAIEVFANITSYIVRENEVIKEWLESEADNES